MSWVGEAYLVTRLQPYRNHIIRVGNNTEIAIQWEILTFWVIDTVHQNKSQCLKAFYGIKGHTYSVLETIIYPFKVFDHCNILLNIKCNECI